MISTLLVRTILAIVVFGAPGEGIATRSAGPAQSAARTISDLGWLAGDWQTASSGRAQIEEHWTQPLAGTMIGMGRTVAGGRTVEFEYLRLEERGGDVFYVAHPKARCPGTDFKLTIATAQSAVFENPQHDFPKRVIYRKNADGSVTASIDGGEGTKSQSFQYQPMKK
jgi:hypothetical protein